ncbi:hypothetical protein AVEN_110224-1 [Araneus ventricosus]|uniref:HTH psq-type domain-containing protein n=1 Tax=Araneus ventricosus TaxID=182803 RepID=A0A4Y2MHZ2_ARAVE|nr:hypothetical protein AVEN_110224-1 [Araneus ventricosus]
MLNSKEKAMDMKYDVAARMDKLPIIKEMDDGMKQVNGAKKYGLSQSKSANFLKKRKQIEEAVHSNEINPQRKRQIVVANGNIDLL